MKALPAVYLKSPQGFQVSKGLKSLIVTPVKNTNYENKDMYVVSGDKIYAKVNLKKPLSINHTVFKGREDKHLVTDAMRKKTWPNVKQFWGYHVELLKSYSPPIYCGKLEKPSLFVEKAEDKPITEVRIYNGRSYETTILKADEKVEIVKIKKLQKQWTMENGKAVFKVIKKK